MTEERKAAILAAVQAEEAAGRRWSTTSIHGIVRGRYAYVSETLRELRAARAEQGGDIAVVEAEEPLEH